jgi:pSer/pThr/pTyr-binding forkhead associated (FHA) protein
MVDEDRNDVDGGMAQDQETDQEGRHGDHPQSGVASEGFSAPQEETGPGAHEFGQLVLKRGGVETEHVFHFSPPALVGRFDPDRGPIDVDLANLPEGQYVSRKHACIVHEDGAWQIEDLGSSNGTFVLRDDFERVEKAEIQDGTEIAFGNARFVFRVREESAPEQ